MADAAGPTRRASKLQSLVKPLSLNKSPSMVAFNSSESPESNPGESSRSSPIDFRKDGTASNIRSHAGNVPVLPKSKLCPHCNATFTRTTHLNRHLRTHTNERQHRCDTCKASFTRSDLLTRHKRTCGDPLSTSRTRRKSCQACADSKIKCNLERPCSKCTARGKECIYSTPSNITSSLNTTGASDRRATRAIEENDGGESGLQGLSIDDLNEFISQTQAQVDSTLSFPSPADIRSNVNDFEFFTSSSYSQSQSAYSQGGDHTPTDFQSALSALNATSSELSSTYNNQLFEPFLSNIFADTSQVFNTQSGEFDATDGTANDPNDALSWAAFPFPTKPVEMQPFMASVEDEWFYSEDFNLGSFGAPPPAVLPQSQPQAPPSLPTPAPSHSSTPPSTATPTENRGPLYTIDANCGEPQTPSSAAMTNPGSTDKHPVTLLDAMGGMYLPEPGPPQEVVKHPDLPVAEMHHYLYLFLSAFQTQVPIIHAPTWQHKGKPVVLMGAAKACGALFVKTKNATQFVAAKLATAREDLVREFAKNPTESLDQIHLMIAVVLLQTIGLFHQRSDQRASSHIYHGMLVMMIRSAGMIARNAAYVPPDMNNYRQGSLDTLWHEWSLHEMTKRALWLSYLHDTCHCIYFAMPSSYLASEMTLFLPCEENLWKASTAVEWYAVLRKPSPYGQMHERLAGVNMPHALGELVQQRVPEEWTKLNPFSHFILIHAILKNLFTVCLDSRLSNSPKTSPPLHGVTQTTSPKGGQTNTEVVEQEIMTLQYALHNWLKSWLAGPNVPRVASAADEPPFVHNALPFYWIGQVALMAYQENHPPFEAGSEHNLKPEARFRMVKQWLKHIRGFLKRADEKPTLLWDELMKIRLQSWQSEAEGGQPDDQEGLLAFFPDV